MKRKIIFLLSAGILAQTFYIKFRFVFLGISYETDIAKCIAIAFLIPALFLVIDWNDTVKKEVAG